MCGYGEERLKAGDEVLSDTGMKGIVMEADYSGCLSTYLVQYVCSNQTVIQCHHPEWTLFKVH